MRSTGKVSCPEQSAKAIAFQASESSKFMALTLTLISTVSLAACDKVNVKWREEVQLEDGVVVIAERTAKGKKYSELGGPGGWKQGEMTVVITKAPNNIKPPPEWREVYVPVLLDYQPFSNSWSMVATFFFCETWYELGRPIPPYIEYQSINGAPWRRVSLEERLIGRKTNILIEPDLDGEPGLVKIGEKERRQRRVGPKYKKILREWGSKEYNFCD